MRLIESQSGMFFRLNHGFSTLSWSLRKRDMFLLSLPSEHDVGSQQNARITLNPFAPNRHFGRVQEELMQGCQTIAIERQNLFTSTPSTCQKIYGVCGAFGNPRLVIENDAPPDQQPSSRCYVITGLLLLMPSFVKATVRPTLRFLPP